MSEANEVKIGVFICHCGGNISDVVDVKDVAERTGKLPDVAISTTHMFTCSDPGQALIEEQIKELGLNRVIVAACSPTLHLPTFRRAAARAGLNQFLVEHVNIREHVSWVIEDKAAATDKAARLIAAAVGRIRFLEPLEMRSIPIHSAALVIGGGVAGLMAARDLAARGMAVTLCEQRQFLGGRMAQLNTLYPTGDKASELLAGLIDDVVGNPLVTVYTGAELDSSEGVVGDFRTRFRIMPRGVSEKADAAKAKAACPESLPCDFQFGLAERKAIYGPAAGTWPQIPAIDWDACTKCGKCAGAGIDLDAQPTEVEVHAGVVVLATGFDPYEPKQGEYGYGELPQVITSQQLQRLLDANGPTGGKIERNGKPINSVAFVHCVGAREYAGVGCAGHDGRVKDYCARTCCTSSLHAALEIREQLPGAAIAHFYQDIRTYGRGHEDYYDKASEAGVMFLRYPAKEPPKVIASGGGAAVVGRDLLTDGIEVEFPADLVVLATGAKPQPLEGLRDIFRCAMGSDGFLLEVHPKLRPVELAVSGVFLAGACQGPMDITEASAAASAAASKAAAMISQGQVEMDPYIATVDESLCSGCETCLTVCPYDAIKQLEDQAVANVNEALCTGCGTCHAACPSAAIQQYGFTDDQVVAEVKALLGGELADLTA